MVRNELQSFGQWLKTTFNAERSVHGIVIGITLLTIWSLINLLAVDIGWKVAFFTFAVLILFLGGFLIRKRRQRTSVNRASATDSNDERKDNREHARKEDISTSLIPQMPSNPPTISAEKNIDGDGTDDFEVTENNVVTAKKEENPSLYRHSFSFKIVLFKIIMAASFWIGFLVGAILLNNMLVWWILGGLTVGIPIYCYYMVLRWNGEEFIVNDTWFERPLTMPFPFHSRTPAIRRSEIGKYEIKQTTLDKMLDLCRLYSDTPSAHDKNFHNVKWLPYPAELRRATGISAPRKNSWLSPLRKRKE